MRSNLATLLLCAAPLGCADEPVADDRGESRPTAQTVDASQIDGGRVASERDAGEAHTADATAHHDAGTAHSVDAATSSGSANDACKGVTADGADGAALHAAAAGLLTQQTPCGFSSCHTGNSRARAGLRLLGGTDLRTLLVGKPSCEAPSLPLVDGSGGAEALARSFLWLKLAAPTDASGVLRANPAWGATEGCGQDPSEPYGQQMPLSTGPLDDADLDIVRSWICAGAPGPT